MRQVSFQEHDADAEWPESRVLVPKVPSWITSELRQVEEGMRGYCRDGDATALGVMQAALAIVKHSYRLEDRWVGVWELWRNPAPLVQACLSTVRLRGEGQVRQTTLLQRVGAARKIYRVMEKHIGIRAEDSLRLFEEALIQHYDLVGDTYRLQLGSKEKTERYTPTLAEVKKLLAEAGRHRGAFTAERDVAIVATLAFLGLRASEVVFDGSAFSRHNGELELEVRTKASKELELYPIPSELVAALDRYVEARNRFAVQCAREHDLVGYGLPGAFWRFPDHRPYTRAALSQMIREASRRVFREIGPHALRRFATWQFAEAAESGEVLDAIGWAGPSNMIRYAPPRGYLLEQPGQSEDDDRRLADAV